MNMPQVFLAYSPRGVGLRCALVYLKEAPHVYGWFTGARNGDLVSAYYMLERFTPAAVHVFWRARARTCTAAGDTTMRNIRPGSTRL